uniref:Uncharacterized protein n=1 Tax=Denticeps clupeoides TaxID=299321 RepID=A0AAY4DDD2_9TELE
MACLIHPHTIRKVQFRANYVPLLGLISPSLVLQVLVGLRLVFIARWQERLDEVDITTTVMVFAVVTVNIFITLIHKTKKNHT